VGGGVLELLRETQGLVQICKHGGNGGKKRRGSKESFKKEGKSKEMYSKIPVFSGRRLR